MDPNDQERFVNQGWPAWLVGSTDTWSGRSDGSGQGYFQRNLSASGLLVLIFGCLFLTGVPSLLFLEQEHPLSQATRLGAAGFCGYLGLLACAVGWGMLRSKPTLTGMAYRVGRASLMAMGAGLIVFALVRWKEDLDAALPGAALLLVAWRAPRWPTPGPPPTDPSPDEDADSTA